MTDKTEEIIDKFYKHLREEISEAKAVFSKEVLKIGNSAHVRIPKKYRGMRARVIIHDKYRDRDLSFETHDTTKSNKESKWNVLIVKENFIYIMKKKY